MSRSLQDRRRREGVALVLSSFKSSRRIEVVICVLTHDKVGGRENSGTCAHNLQDMGLRKGVVLVLLPLQDRRQRK